MTEVKFHLKCSDLKLTFILPKKSYFYTPTTITFPNPNFLTKTIRILIAQKFYLCFVLNFKML